MVKIILPIFLLFAILVSPPSSAFAQGGNDFPVSPSFPTYPPGGTVGFPPNSGAWQWGGTMGPVVQAPALNGDTIVFDVVGNCRGCYWGFAYPLHASPIISNGTDMRLEDDPNKWQHWLDNGDWVTFCVGRCTFSVKAGEDYPWLRLGYDGNSGWYNEIAVQYVIPAPQPPPPSTMASWFKVLTDPDKQTAGNIGAALASMSGVTTGAGITFGGYGGPYFQKASAILQAIGYGAGLISSAYINKAKDPYDPNYCTPVGSGFNWQVYNDLYWTFRYTEDSGTWLPWSIIMLVSASDQGQIAIDRALSAAQADEWDGNAAMCAWERRAEAHNFIHEMGQWMWYFRKAVEDSANALQGGGIDQQFLDDAMYSRLGELGEAATWSESVQ